MWVKICGITRTEDAAAAARFGADAIGMVFAESPRKVTPDEAKRISLEAPRGPSRVGVFVDSSPEEVLEIVDYCGLDLAQLHGGEGRGHFEALGNIAIKAARVRSLSDMSRVALLPFERILFDCPGGIPGTSDLQEYDWSLVRFFDGSRQVILAGGLTPENIGAAIRAARPYGVDVSSGVESSPGLKDAAKMYRFIEKARKTDYEVSHGEKS